VAQEISLIPVSGKHATDATVVKDLTTASHHSQYHNYVTGQHRGLTHPNLPPTSTRITRMLKRRDVLEREGKEGRMTVDEVTKKMFSEVSN
jgi:hypothetical protein